MRKTTPSRVCAECGAALPEPKVSPPRRLCAVCRPSGAAAREQADPNSRVRSNARTPNEVLLIRLRHQGVHASLWRGPDGLLQVVRPCADCDTPIPVSTLGRPRERCAPCSEKRHDAAVRAWKEAHAEYGAEWRAAHPTYQRDFARANLEKMREYRRKHASEHREEVNAKARRWRAAHRDHVNEQLRRRRAERPGEHAAAMRAWRAAHAKPPESAG